jgi:hypothetical protein
VAPANQMTYDTVQFYNSTVASAGLGSALLPCSCCQRCRRQCEFVEFTLRDLRGLAAADFVGR